MDIGKCCVDCIFCMLSTSPIESGTKWVCVHPHEDKHKVVDGWSPPCHRFVDAS